MKTRTLILGLAMAALAPITAGAHDTEYPGGDRYIPSPNYTSYNSRHIDRVVIHTIEGSEMAGVSWMQNPASKVSAHYVQAKSGRITQMVREVNKAWHCSAWNYRSIGIECEGRAGENGWTSTQMRRLAQLTRYLCDKYSIPIDRTHLVGHVEVPGATHWDPGPHFNWSNFLHLVRTNGGNGQPDPDPGPGPDPKPEPKPEPKPGVTAPKVTASVLNVRTSAWGTIIGKTRNGNIHGSNYKSGDWTRIHFGSRTAYFWTGYTTPSSARVIRVNAKVLNVRSKPFVSSSTLVGKSYAGQMFREVYRSGSWVLVQYDHRKLWVHGGYVTRVK